jgi:RNA polymerase primary sigma factor
MFPHQDAALRAYLRDIGGLPLPLSAADEAHHLRAALKGDRQAQRILVETNLRLVIVIAARFQGRGLSIMDLLQEGNLGLYDTINLFDLSKKTRFATFAKFHVLKRIGRAIAERAPLIHTPYSTAQNMQKIERAVSEFMDQGINPTTAMIAKRVELSVEHVAELLILLQEPLSLNQQEEDHDPLATMIAAPPLVLSNEVSSPSLLIDVKEMISEVLTEDEQQIIELRFGLDGEGIIYDYHEIAEKLYYRTGSRADERIRQLERSALAKLRSAFEKEA